MKDEFDFLDDIQDKKPIQVLDSLLAGGEGSQDLAETSIATVEAAFPPHMAYEIALAFDPYNKVYPKHGVSKERWKVISRHPEFLRTVREHRREIEENGLTYRKKAKVQAEAYLVDTHILIKNPLTPPNVKLDAMKFIAKMADYEPKEKDIGNGVIFNLQINV